VRSEILTAVTIMQCLEDEGSRLLRNWPISAMLHGVTSQKVISFMLIDEELGQELPAFMKSEGSGSVQNRPPLNFFEPIQSSAFRQFCTLPPPPSESCVSVISVSLWFSGYNFICIS